jgi:hypothetical protein
LPLHAILAFAGSITVSAVDRIRVYPELLARICTRHDRDAVDDGVWSLAALGVGTRVAAVAPPDPDLGAS